MERFLTRHRDRIAGTLAGFDRLRFRGTLRSISYVKGVEIFLSTQGVLLKDFGQFAHGLSDRLKTHAETVATEAGRPLAYLPSSRVSKEDHARAIAQRDGITEGLVCVLSCVEGCRSFGVRKDRTPKHLVVTSQERKCLHLYFYYLDREFGLMHLRLQTWLPFTIQVCVNGREWLARRLTTAGIGYTQVDHAFTALADPARAQTLLDTLTTRAWPSVLAAWARRVTPWPAGLDLRPYYWSLDESAYATDVIFHDAAARQPLYPALTRHALERFGSQEAPLLRAVLRGEHALQGFRNADRRRLLCPKDERDPVARRQAAGRVTRCIRLRRAHRLIRTTAGTRYYRVSPYGQAVMSTALGVRDHEVAVLAA